ncbi:MAG: T9SS type A sorting domain-containing protein [Cytophagales bacterium]|nr:T9SS type A sorting domain-containing protein [Cytophagales bacterium]
MKRIILTFSFVFVFRTIILSCTCISQPNFCTIIDSFGVDLIIKGVKVSEHFHGMKVKVLEVLNGNELKDTIIVWGGSDALCRFNTDSFNISDTLILALDSTDFIMNIDLLDTIEKPGDYMLTICGHFFLRIFNDTVVGYISDSTIQKMSYNDFKSFVFSCLRLLVPNGAFENWSWIGGWYENPDNWTTNNNQILNFVWKDTTAFQGNYAIGIKPNGYARTKFQYSTHPNSLNAYVKSNISGADSVFIDVFLFSGGSIVDEGHWINTNSITNYALINIPLSQNSSVVDSIEISIKGGKQINTVVVADELSFDFLPAVGISINHSNFKKSKLLLYPNPFNDATTIEYTLKENSLVKLNIYNISGQFVTKLVNEHNQPKGKHQIRFDAGNLAPGLYFCTITTKDYTASHKFSVVK